MLRSFCAALLSLAIMAAHTLSAIADDAPVYELRTYVCEPGKLDALHARFRDHTMRIFEKHGMENIAYWQPIEGDAATNTLVYLLRHKSRDAAKASWDAFRQDPEWKKVAAESREKHGKILAQAPDVVFLAATDYSPKIGHADSSHVYELRTYTAADSKLQELHARFRNHTDQIFAKHGMKSYSYWKPLDEPQSTNVLIYILEHKDRASARDAWKSFASDPDWKTAKAKSERNGPLLAKRPDAIFMKTTDFSPEP